MSDKDALAQRNKISGFNLLKRPAYSFGYKAGLFKCWCKKDGHATSHNDLYHFAPDVLPLIFTDAYIAGICDLLEGSATWIPECAVHRERFFGWHKDSSGAERAGMVSHKTYTDPMLTAAVYFQDNGLGGGGLSVVAGSHRSPDKTLHYYSKSHALKNWLFSTPLCGMMPWDRNFWNFKSADQSLFTNILANRPCPNVFIKGRSNLAFQCCFK